MSAELGPASTFVFRIHPERLAIARLPAGSAVPPWAGGSWCTISHTVDELSIVCPQSRVPAAVQQERDKIAFGIEGVIPMTTIGLLAALCRALADAQVPVFAISTYDTDWLLVSADRLPAARRALERLGHRFSGSPPP
ncbi:MAG: ACT domain-containing protein [Planctomycetota bacterium]|nr:MAG: ACT domain-containing protein [Planctomycetota bacterium]